ncbi:helix-turn-helix domain-containing protein [Halomonas binhaiensis]|uniref:DNA binding HTH domain-containing protein n=1 Tax=Halomonas binhaiensis TaxID=2562282 RepID=A0A5C1NF33_9GAMM|nr:hypothetical protein E4T21_00925 [Halomonas binhaiensis]
MRIQKKGRLSGRFSAWNIRHDAHLLGVSRPTIYQRMQRS